MIKKYRPKTSIEAIKFDGNASEIEAFIKNIPYDNTETSEYKDTMSIPSSLEWAKIWVHLGDYVVKTDNGSFDVYPNDFFEREFEEIKNSEDTENKQDEQVVEEDKDNHDYKEAKGENKMELKDTITLMTSADYKERFKAEYSQVKIRYEKLLAMINKWEKGELTFTPTCPKEVYDIQLKAMKEYLDILVLRARMEGIDL